MKPDFAFYYPGQYWRNVNWIKNLVCFFDGIAILVPDGMPNPRPRDDEPITWSLKDHGLLRTIRPEEIIDEEATEALAKAFDEIITSGRLDHLIRRRAENLIKTDFENLAKAKLGTHINKELANSISHALYSRQLAYDPGDGVSIAVDRTILVLVLVLLAHILIPKGKDTGITLSPATDQREVVKVMGEILKPESSPPAIGDIVSFDMAEIGINLGPIPIDEILDFRKDNYCQHRDYIQSVRDFTRELSRIPSDEREVKFEQRQEELADKSSALRSIYQRSWKIKLATFGIGLMGAALTYENDPIAAALLSANAILGAVPEKSNEVDVYSYLFSAQQRF